MIDKKLRGVLSEAMFEDFTTGHSRFNEEKTKEMVKVIISQIKALVVESLGEEKNIYKDDWACNDGIKARCNGDCVTCVFGYNQHIAEMKQKWG